jgi:ribonuclease P protein component
MRRQSEFLLVRRNGKSCAGRYLVLACLQDKSVPDFKFGFVTSRRVGNAVARNLVRRRLRSIVQREGEGIEQGHYMVMIARKGAAEASFDALRRDWKSLVGRCGLGT